MGYKKRAPGAALFRPRQAHLPGGAVLQQRPGGHDRAQRGRRETDPRDDARLHSCRSCHQPHRLVGRPPSGPAQGRGPDPGEPVGGRPVGRTDRLLSRHGRAAAPGSGRGDVPDRVLAAEGPAAADQGSQSTAAGPTALAPGAASARAHGLRVTSMPDRARARAWPRGGARVCALDPARWIEGGRTRCRCRRRGTAGCPRGLP